MLSAIFKLSIAPVPMVMAPVAASVASPPSVAKNGRPLAFASKSCPLVPAAEAATALVPLPKSTPLVVSVLVPVPPLTTGKIPSTSEARSTEVPKVDAIEMAPDVFAIEMPKPGVRVAKV